MPIKGNKTNNFVMMPLLFKGNKKKKCNDAIVILQIDTEDMTTSWTK